MALAFIGAAFRPATPLFGPAIAMTVGKDADRLSEMEAFMSARNGDKARFGRLRQQKIARRQRMRELRSRIFQGQQAASSPQITGTQPTISSSKASASLAS